MKWNLGTKQKGVKMRLTPPQNKQTENPTHPWSQNVKVIIFLLWTSVPVLCGWKCHKYTLYYTGGGVATVKVLQVLKSKLFSKYDSHGVKNKAKDSVCDPSSASEDEDGVLINGYWLVSNHRSPTAPCAEWCARAIPRGWLGRIEHRPEAQKHSSYGCCCQCFPGRAAKTC